MLRKGCWQLVLAALLGAWLPLAGAAAGGNPFLGQKFYVNPGNSKQFETSIVTATGEVKQNLLAMQQVPSAYWIDTKEKIKGTDMRHMGGILRDAASKPTPELVVLIWYDLPNRDCDAKASNGEICCKYTPEGKCDYAATGDCADGIHEYKTTYVDPFVEVLQEFQDLVPIVVIVEPDSLPNLATNTGHPHCGNPATGAAYKAGVKYALDQVTSLAPKVAVYLDAAHGGWVGWENNLMKFMDLLKDMDLPLDKVRGFATNVANYQPLGIQCPWCPDSGYRNGFCLNGKHQSHPCCDDPCKLSSQYNFGNNELNYAAGLVAAANGELGMDAHVMIDTGRNGVVDQRQDCANWCNPRGAGAGIISTTETANQSLVDAYYWLKTPGESDGCSQTLPNGKTCPRFDAGCASPDSLGVHSPEDPAPEAGHWYDFQVKQLAQNARFKGSAAQQAAMADPEPATCDGNGGGQQQPQPQQPQPQPQPRPQSPSPSGGSSSQASSTGTSVTSPSSSSSSSSGNCGSAFSQCGGTMWNGPSCCEAGCQCLTNGPSYSQCVPTKPGGSCSSSEEPGEGSLPAGLPAAVEPEPSPASALRHAAGSNLVPAMVDTETPAPTPKPATQLVPFEGPLPSPAPQPGAPHFPPIPHGTFLAILGKDCYGDGQHDAYDDLVGDPSTCRELCFYAHTDCTAVIVWKSSCFFRTTADCYNRLVDAVDHTVYILKDRNPGSLSGNSPFSDAPTSDTPEAAPSPKPKPQPMTSLPQPTPKPTPVAPQPGPSLTSTSVPEGAFKTLSGMDCFGGENAYGKVGRPETCKQECLNEHPDCVAVVKWGGLCFFRNNPQCGQNLEGSPLHTTYLRANPQTKAISIATSEQEQFQPISGKDCFSGQNAYHVIGDPSTCKSECLHNYNDCVAVVIWNGRCFFRNQPSCKSNAQAAPQHMLYLVKARSGLSSANTGSSLLGRSAALPPGVPALAAPAAPEQWFADAAAGVAGEAVGDSRRSSGVLAAVLGASSAAAALLGAAAAAALLAGAVRSRRRSSAAAATALAGGRELHGGEVAWQGLPSMEPEAIAA